MLVKVIASAAWLEKRAGRADAHVMDFNEMIDLCFGGSDKFVCNTEVCEALGFSSCGGRR